MTTLETTIDQEQVAVNWPAKYDLLGVQVSGTTYHEALETIIQAAKRGERAIVTLAAVHAIVTASRNPELREQMNRFAIVAPDGQPVRWALNRLYGLRLPDRVYGPELTLRICRCAAAERLSIYLYGGTPQILKSLEENLLRRFPGLVIAGGEAPPFRPLTAEEDEAVVRRVNGSGAAILFIGLGCPKQDHFAADHSDRIEAVQVCVGAAFDFHAGAKRMAPAWMQRRGLEWLFRLSQEPGRLWRRYLETNSIFIARFAWQWVCGLFRRSRKKAAPTGGVPAYRENNGCEESSACATDEVAPQLSPCAGGD
jgi:N-acetylglucosaminyldiphosphoundecaprenol N-acetyl-beta-D-mannosaminyltransferase